MDALELLLGVRMADVQHVQQQIGVDGFFQRGLEAGDEVVRQVADEADGVATAALRVPRSSCQARVLVSSVAKSLSSAYVPAAVSVLNSVLLPALV